MKVSFSSSNEQDNPNNPQSHINPHILLPKIPKNQIIHKNPKKLHPNK